MNVGRVLMVGGWAFALLVQACAGSDDDGGGTSKDDAFTERASESKQAKSPDRPRTDDTNATTFAVKEAIVLEQDIVFGSQAGAGEDAGPVDISRARIVISNRGNLCDRVNEGLMLDKDETLVSFWVDGTSFSKGSLALKAEGTRSAGSSYVEAKSACSGDEQEMDRGTGTLDMTSSSKGSFKVTFKSGTVSGTFDAKACPKKRTLGFMSCPVE